MRKDLRAMLADGLCFSIMTGAGEAYFPAFVLACGLGETPAGLIATVPMLVGALTQLFAPALVRQFRSHRRWVITSVLIQTLSFLPLIVAAFSGGIPLLAAFAAVSVYWAGGLGGASAWTTWVGRLVPEDIRAPYFARRHRLIQLGLVGGLVAAGAALQIAETRGVVLPTFGAIFCLAAAARLTSACVLSTKSEPHQPIETHRTVTPRELAARARRGGDAALLLYLLAAQAATQVAAPFFTPYMLQELRFPYWTYTALTAVPYVSRVVCLPLFGRFADRRGAMSLMRCAGAAIVPMAGIWTLGQSFAWLFVAQVLAGVAWAAFELASMLLYFEAIREDERTSILSTYMLLNAAAIVAGSLVGAALLNTLGRDVLAYYVVFGASTAARLAALLLLFRVRAEGRAALARPQA